jgi:hypothetical protein
MKNKMRILALICAGLLVVGCESKKEEQITPKTETTQAAAAVPTVPSSSEPGMQALVDTTKAPAELSTTTGALSAGPGATMTVAVIVKNDSTVPFMAAKDLSSTENEIDFVVNYMDSTGKPVDSLKSVIPLPDTLAVGQSGTYQLPINAPTMKGDYTLQINMAQQGKIYFSDAGVKSVSIPVSVK